MENQENLNNQNVQVEQTSISEELQLLIDNQNVYFFDKMYEDEHLGSFTESYNLAKELGWQDNYIAKDQTEIAYNGWTFKKGFAPNKPLQLAKDQKHSELKNILVQKRQSLKVEFNGDEFDANEGAQNNMNTLVGLFNLGATEVQIRSANEVTHTFDKDQCTQLSLVMVQGVQNLYSAYWNLKDSLYACETLEGIEKISWE